MLTDSVPKSSCLDCLAAIVIISSNELKAVDELLRYREQRNGASNSWPLNCFAV